MPFHECEQVETITKLCTIVDRLEKTIDGNGSQQGLRDTVLVLSVNVKELSENSKILTSAISDIVKFQTETVTTEKMRERNKINVQWMLGILIAVVAAFGSYITLIK